MATTHAGSCNIPNSYISWNEKWKHEPVNKTSTFAKRAFTFLESAGLQGVHILELGSGLGEDAHFFLKQGLSVTVSDFSESCLERIPPHINMHAMQIDVSQLPKSLGKYNVIYAHLSLHYFDSKITRIIFSEIKKHITTGGYLFVKCKSSDDMLAKTGIPIGDGLTDVNGKNYHFFSKETMRDYARDFHIVSLKKTSSIYKNYRSSFIELIAQNI